MNRGIFIGPGSVSASGSCSGAGFTAVGSTGITSRELARPFLGLSGLFRVQIAECFK